MKDINRIPKILGLLEQYWDSYPDLRLCQLLYQLLQKGPVDIYYVEDEVLEAKLDESLP